MNTVIPMLLFVSAVATGFAPQSAAQGTNQRKEPVAGARSGSRVPVDVSLQGLGDVSGLAPGDAARGGSVSATPSVGSVTPLAFSCAPSIRDQAAGGCVQASSTPAFGRLYPLGPEFNIDVAGNVGIGTTSPAAKLEVAGTARVTDTLTLAPSGDQALDVSTGSIYEAGALFIHTKGGRSNTNTALGRMALSNVTIGSRRPSCRSWSSAAAGYAASRAPSIARASCGR